MLNSPSAFNKTLSARVSNFDTQTVKAVLPGEVSGSSVVFTLSLRNRADQVVDLDQLVVNLLDGNDDPATRISSAPATQMPRALGKGTSADARFVFVVPAKARKNITIEVSLTAEEPVLIFKGSVD